MPPLDLNETNWIVQVNESLSLELMPSDEQQYWEKRSIYRVPAGITVHNREAYRPQTVSFGPFHHGDDHLRPMEDHKRRVLVHFLRRSGKPLEHFLESLREVAGDLEESYDTLDPKWMEGGGKGVAGLFLQLMITDGCFMLEILRTTSQEANDYAPNDPIFSNHGKLYVLPNIRRDMLLLENQLPMLVLDRLVAVCDGKKEDEYINRLILDCFCSPSPNNPRMGKCLHVLDVFRKNLVQPTLDKAVSKRSKEIIRSATELREHGIRFRNSNTYSLKDISFASGIMRLPTIKVDEDTESIFLNLIAFERFHVEAGNEVTSYISFMNNIIDRGQDVALLHTKGIIQNAMESDEAAAKLFNSLAKDVMLDPDSSLHDVINKVREYCKKRRHKWRANLMHTYFRNPWVILSLIAAFLLFGLSIIQTVYTVLSYKK
ncbi:UPF0481 protein At3g47200-like [Rhodamnia argentea]|uniref:UPF0481 protein At3g47200-like n=1 Tax=Rhodamnia argentea TaxID=178133 RepID=A0A8B8MUN3_9MYRT|nr:UPF0481 protein At3g47200-like [Rhodamnia argentea]